MEAWSLLFNLNYLIKPNTWALLNFCMKDHYEPYCTDEEIECLFGRVHIIKKWQNQDQTSVSDLDSFYTTGASTITATFLPRFHYKSSPQSKPLNHTLLCRLPLLVSYRLFSLSILSFTYLITFFHIIQCIMGKKKIYLEIYQDYDLK